MSSKESGCLYTLFQKSEAQFKLLRINEYSSDQYNRRLKMAEPNPYKGMQYCEISSKIRTPLAVLLPAAKPGPVSDIRESQRINPSLALQPSQASFLCPCDCSY
eukprot:4883815-Amphidinium_carterae.1